MVDVEIPNHEGRYGSGREGPFGGQGGGVAAFRPGVVDVEDVEVGEIGAKKGRAPQFQLSDINPVRKKNRKY
jgi:hypothetical protein